MSIRCAIVGIGNCCSALVQGVAVAAAGERELEGVSFPSIGGFLPEALRFVAAFDIDARKVGTPLSAAIFSAPNCCFQIARSPGELGALPSVLVSSAPVMDGVAPHMLTAPAHLSFRLTETPALTRREVVELLAARQVDVLINYLPVGSRECTEFWAAVCIEAGVALANCIPCFVASDPAWEARFIDAGLPLIGDDMRSQFGASVVSQMLEELALARGVRITVHIQQNSGVSDRGRLASKKTSKENVIRAPRALAAGGKDGGGEEAFIHAGPSDYIACLGDAKVANFRVEGKGFGGAPFALDARLKVEDSPNSAGVVIDAVRFLKVAREMGLCGSLRGASAFSQKTPPQPLSMVDARLECEALARRELTAITRLQLRAAPGATTTTTTTRAVIAATAADVSHSMRTGSML